MKFHEAWLVAGLALVVGASPTAAADWGGVKDVGGGVAIPVPPPAPVPTFDADSDWYVGLSLGGDISQDAKITSTGEDALGNPIPGIGVKNSSDIGLVPTFGLSFGRYITPSLRVEFSTDYHPNEDLSNGAVQTFTADRSALGPVLTGPGGTTIQTVDTNHYTVDRTDSVQLARTTGLVNLLYDIDTGTRFTPYIGGGLGFTWRRMKRSFTENATCDFSSNTVIAYPATTCTVNNSSLPATYTNTGSNGKDQIDLAAAVQAGVGYAITDSITWDNSWQMLWEGGAILLTQPTVAGTSTVKYSDAVLQQFRTGLRFRFN